MKRLLPETLAGRTIAILVIGLGIFHLWSIWVYQIGGENLLGLGGERDVADRLLSAVRAIEAVPANERAAVALGLASPDLHIGWSAASPLDPTAPEGADAGSLRQRLLRSAPDLSDERLRFASGAVADAHHRQPLRVAVKLADGSWASFGVDPRHPANAGAMAVEHDVLGSLTAMALGILVVSVLLVRSITAPLRELASAAERVGTDIAAAGAPETGPREIRHVAHAFNTMQGCIRRLLGDRTQTLAAVSHDLKTPITRLRLRAAFVGDAELRRSIEDDLDEMERMLEQTLAFLRSESSQEERRAIDLASMLKTICDDLTDAGHGVTLVGSERAVLQCRPLALKRAFSNLIDNAIKYGERARVSLAEAADDLVVTIADDGPGIAAAERERVFDPFYRIEGSRSRETGGTGLGLTVARTAIRAHGGDVRLEDGQPAGLRVVVSLPRTPDR